MSGKQHSDSERINIFRYRYRQI